MECSSKEMNGVEEIFENAITIAVGDEHFAPDEKPFARPGAQRGASGVSGAAKKKKKPKSCTIL